jgi:hypothetical protein
MYMPSMRDSRKALSVEVSRSGVNRDNLIKIPTTANIVPNHHNVTKLKVRENLSNLLLTNCRSLNLSKRDELSSLLETENIDIALLRPTETWLYEEKEAIMNIDGYNMMTANRANRVGEGVAIVTKTLKLKRSAALLARPSQRFGYLYNITKECQSSIV